MSNKKSKYQHYFNKSNYVYKIIVNKVLYKILIITNFNSKSMIFSLGPVCFCGCTVHKQRSERIFGSRILWGRERENIPVNSKYSFSAKCKDVEKKSSQHMLFSNLISFILFYCLCYFLFFITVRFFNIKKSIFYLYKM